MEEAFHSEAIEEFRSRKGGVSEDDRQLRANLLERRSLDALGSLDGWPILIAERLDLFAEIARLPLDIADSLLDRYRAEFREFVRIFGAVQYLHPRLREYCCEHLSPFHTVDR